MTKPWTYKGYVSRIELDAEEGLFVGRIAGIADSVSFHAETVADLKAAFEEAVDDYLDTCARIGKAPDKAYSGQMMFRVNPETHRKAVIAADLAGKSLNQWAEEVLCAAASGQA
jgi:predicted HicB family RNase H-like nuclease